LYRLFNQGCYTNLFQPNFLRKASLSVTKPCSKIKTNQILGFEKKGPKSRSTYPQKCIDISKNCS